jgi:hypothetical protein
MSEDFDYSLFGDVLVKPSTGEKADPLEVLSDKVVSVALLEKARFMSEILLFWFPYRKKLLLCEDNAIFWSSLVGT